MIEPARSDGHVSLGSNPLVTLLGAVLAHILGNIDVGPLRSPMRISHIAPLIAGPGHVRLLVRVSPHIDVRLKAAHKLVCRCPAVILLGNLSCLIRPAIPSIASIGPVKPDLEHITIAGQEFGQLVTEIFHICFTAIFGVIPVPRRKIDCELKSLLAAGLCQLCDHVSLAILPWAVLHGILCICGRPHAESAMMLGSENDAFHSGFPAGPGPLPRIEMRRIEQGRVLIAIAPLLTRISIQGIMNKCISLHFLNGNLVLSRHRSAGSRRVRSNHCRAGCCQKSGNAQQQVVNSFHKNMV